MKLSHHPVLPSKYFSVNTKVTEFANNSNYGSGVFIGTEIGFSVPAVQRSVFNKQQTQSHQLCWGSLDIVPFPGTAAEVPALLPAQTSASGYLRVVTGKKKKKKSHFLSPAQAEIFNKPLLSFQCCLNSHPPASKLFGKTYKKKEEKSGNHKFPSAFPSARLSCLYLYKGGTGSFYLGVVT